MLRSVTVQAGNPVNQAGNAFIVIAAQGVLTVTFNDGSVLQNVVAGDSFDFSIPGSYGQKSQIDHYEYFKVDSTVSGDSVELQIGWGKKYQLPAGGGVVPGPPSSVTEFSPTVANSNENGTILGGASTTIAPVAGIPRRIIVSAPPTNAGPIVVGVNGPAAGEQVAPGDNVTILAADVIAGGFYQVTLSNPGTTSVFYSARWEF